MVTDSIAFLNPFCFEFRIKCNSLVRIVSDFAAALDVAVELLVCVFREAGGSRSYSRSSESRS